MRKDLEQQIHWKGGEEVRIFLGVTFLVLITLSKTGLAMPEVLPVSSTEARTWAMYTVPLPKEMKITGKVRVSPSQVEVFAPLDADVTLRQAVKELLEIGFSQGNKTSARDKFAITFVLNGPEAQALKSLKNSDQSYEIRSEEAGLKLIGLTSRGLYYASKTLQQLIKARSTASTAEIPLLNVIDWPDMEDRGLWGTDAFIVYPWLADRKMNYIEQISSVGLDKAGKPLAQIKPSHMPLLMNACRYGINFVPVVLHLEQVGPRIFPSYPMLKAQGGAEGAICYSRPEIVDVLADWLVQFGSYPGVSEVDVWMSENLHQKGGCTCPECSKTDRDVLEARAILAGWRKARKTLPNLGLRILTSEETEDGNELVFKELPREVKVWYYHSLLTYDASERPILRQYLADFAKNDGWLGVCPSICATVHWASPFTCADFVYYRLQEFHKKGVRGLLGYTTPRVLYYRYLVEAAAEWSWNMQGRTPEEFALSWAVRNRLPDPPKFAKWSSTLGKVAWDVYGSHWPSGEQRGTPGPSAKRLKEGTLPELGFVLWDAYNLPWGDIKSEKQLDDDVAAADEALKLAEEMGIPEFYYESQIVRGYIRSLKALWELRKIVHPNGIAPENKKKAAEYFGVYEESLQQVIDTLPKWEALVPKNDNLTFTDHPIEVMKNMISEMKQVAAEFGINAK